MTRIDSTKLKWQVQIRRSIHHKWVSKGTYETRENAREKAAELRTSPSGWNGESWDVYGFRNTRVVRKPVK